MIWSPSTMPHEWSACVIVMVIPATRCVPPLFMGVVFWMPFPCSQWHVSKLATTWGVVVRGLGVVHHPGVDEQDLAAGGSNFDGGVPEPCDAQLSRRCAHILLLSHRVRHSAKQPAHLPSQLQ